MNKFLRYIVGTPGIFCAAVERKPRHGERVIGIRTRIDDDLIRRRPAKSDCQEAKAREK